MPVCGNFQRRSHYSATTAHRALPVREWPAMDMPWGTAMSNAASAVCSRDGGAWGLRQGCAGCLLGVWFCRLFVKSSRGGVITRQPLRTEPCQCVGGQPWACHRVLESQRQPLQCAAGVLGPALGAAAGVLCRWLVGGAVLPVCGGFLRRRQPSATTAHRALPVCEWPAPGIPWGTARSNAASVVCRRGGGASTGGCGRAGQVACGGCGFAGLWSCPEDEAALSKHRVQSPASV